MELYEKARHEPLKEIAWDETKAKAAIEAIVADALGRASGGANWPFHPLDAQPGETEEKTRSLYFGAAGMVWALGYLNEAGAAAQARDWRPELRSLFPGAFPDIPNWTPSKHSYLFGDSPVLLLEWKLTRSAAAADALEAGIAANVKDDTLDLMWSAPGTMLAALFMHEWTGEARWRELFLANEAWLWETFRPAEEAPCRLWTQNLYGNRLRVIGGVHGFAGNAFPIIKGFHLLSAERRAEWTREIVRTLSALAQTENGLVNWPPSVGPPRPGRSALLVQHCHGAPGIITCLAGLEDPGGGELDRLLLQAGELTWAAGPLAKGSNLCHGTAGNGYPFLKLYERTGEAKWLSRARAFAMHSIDQWEAASREYGVGRYSLWTGDVGLAVYLWDCINGAARFPTMDVF